MSLKAYLVASATLGLLGCTSLEPSPPEEAPAQRIPNGIKLDAKSARFEYLKFEAVVETLGGPLMTLPGKVAFDDDHTQRVASPVDGRVHAMAVKLGDRVRAGQTLVELSSPQVAQLQSEGVRAQQDFSVAQKALDRARRLRADGAVSEKEFTQIEADFAKARSEVARSTAQLQTLGLKPGEPTTQGHLLAAISGTVVERNVLVGQEVRADGAQPLLTLSDLTHVWVLADVYEQDLAQVQVGGEVAVRVPAHPEEVFPGTVQYISDVVDPNSRTLKVRCSVANERNLLKPDMFARVELRDTSGRKSLMVPAKAILSDGDRNEVVASAGAGVLQLKPVEIGAEIDGKVRVLKGLSPGEVIVTDGALFARQEIKDQ